MEFKELIEQEGVVYCWTELPMLISRLRDWDLLPTVAKRLGKSTVEVYNVPMAFDCETSSFYNKEGEKQATMYIWTFCIQGYVVSGRTWGEYLSMLDILVKELDVSAKKSIIIYIQNLAYEFQFMKDMFQWESVFAMKKRTPLYARTGNGIEFRCSYILSMYSLASMGKNLVKYNIKKKEGDLDYDKPRHCLTQLTPAEMAYCENDVRVVVAFIAESIENDPSGSITNLPLTNTGYVRRYCRDECLKKKDKESRKFRKLVQSLTLSGPEEYLMAKQVFSGGFTHANAYHSGKTVDNVASYDFGSAYPYVMCVKQYPMSKGEKIKIRNTEELELMLKTKCCMFEITFRNIVQVFLPESYISASKCLQLENAVENNGRVSSASLLKIAITEVDYDIIKQVYEWDAFKIGTFYAYSKGYLPKSLITTVINLYKDKTELKDVSGKEIEYLRKKGMLNSTYGMIVTDIAKALVGYDTEWNEEGVDLDEMIEKYNNDKKRFLFYIWGPWVTAYNRANLFTAILECGDDYVYSDTDSVKIKNKDAHAEYFEKYNKYVGCEIDRVVAHYGLDRADFSPKTVEGVEKTIGIWDYEGESEQFRTLGAKRYMNSKRDKDGNLKYQITVSGLAKSNGVDHLIKTSQRLECSPFDIFDNGMYIPANDTGKSTHTYLDNPFSGTLIDYNGMEYEYEEMSAIHLEGCEFSMSMSEQYVNYLESLFI